MTERPILFNGAMVRALLDGSKTQTRRVTKPQPEHQVREIVPGIFDVVRPPMIGQGITGGEVITRELRCPYGVPGDRLWVRETFALSKSDPDSGADTRYSADWDVPIYRADVPSSMTSPSAVTSWKPSIHMPRWASRITLEVTDVRVERVQTICEPEIRSEGITVEDDGIANGFFNLRPAWISLWDSIYAKQGLGWEVNPWVWAVDFKVVTP